MSYASIEEFFRALRKETPSADEQVAAQRALDAATGEIDAYLSWETGPPAGLPDESMALVVQVNLDRAAEHWRLTPYGALNQGPEIGTVMTARNTWYRHAQNLASLKVDWGVA